MATELPPIPPKRYFTIGEVSELCGVKSYVLRYWEQEFSQLKPMKRRGNRRYYQHHEVQLIRRIRELLYDEGFTISGARNRLSEPDAPPPAVAPAPAAPAAVVRPAFTLTPPPSSAVPAAPLAWPELRRELLALRAELDQALGPIDA
ncbi:MerR family transcriptional regulator [Amphibiibacter pelophylacis]|uniref:MerR family transcriptional regulator n=1 Tax=Amphibiibacter pelophylacis TaxID=1799477 RepID=A0ACC6NYS7_9BURK